MAWLSVFNHLSGAGCLALVIDLAYARTNHWPAALLAGLLLVVTAAFFYHSVQTTEPMIALFWFLTAWRLLTSDGTLPHWRVVASSFAYALSVASYQSFFLGGVGLLVLAWTSCGRGSLWLSGGFVAGTSLFVAAACADGATDVGAVCRYLTQKPDGAYWGFFQVKSLPGTVVGFCHAVWPLFGSEWPGFARGFALLSPFHRIELLVRIVLVVFPVAFVLYQAVRPPVRRCTWAGLAVFLGALFAPFYLDTYYYKLWLLPLAAFSLLLAPGLARSPVACRFALGLATLVFSCNLPSVYYKYHRLDNPQTATLVNLERCLTDKDLLVCDGWDHSLAYIAKYPKRSVYALIRESPDPGRLQERIDQTIRQNGRVFFIGLLEKTPDQWGLTDLPRRGRMGYRELDRWRQQGTLVWQGVAAGATEDLYVLPSRGP